MGNNFQQINNFDLQATIQQRYEAIGIMKTEGVQAYYFPYSKVGQKGFKPVKILLKLSNDETKLEFSTKKSGKACSCL